MSKINFDCLAICLNLALTSISLTSLPVPSCVPETLCQPWNYPHVLHQPNDFSIQANDSVSTLNSEFLILLVSNDLQLCIRNLQVSHLESSNQMNLRHLQNFGL